MDADQEGSHDHISNRSTHDTDSDMEDTVEFRILMAYAQRRHPKKATPADKTGSNGTAPTQTPDETKHKEPSKKKKTKQWRRVLSIFKCVRPQTEEEKEPYQTPAVMGSSAGAEEKEEGEEDYCDFKEGQC